MPEELRVNSRNPQCPLERPDHLFALSTAGIATKMIGKTP
jgi:hypothetical protein